MERIILDQNTQAFIELARAGNSAEALSKLRNEISMQQALYGCDELSIEVINDLIQKSTPGLDDRNRLVLELVRDLVMPQRPIMGGAGLDLDEARRYLLEKIADQKKTTTPAQPYPMAAYKNCFYPEFLSFDKRSRVVYLAENHKNLGPHYPRQISFFSLGGCFNWTTAGSETSPSGTTCGKFVRSCLFGAGCRPIEGWHSVRSTIHNYIGLGNQGTRNPAFVKFDPNKQPKKGDVFWIYSGTMIYKGKSADDSHVGVIVNVIDATTWETIEGGQSKNWTRKFTRKIVMDGSKPAFSRGGRRIQGWVDIDRLNWAF